MPRRRYFGSITPLGKDSSGVKVWRLRWMEHGKRHTESVHGPYSQAEKRLAQIHARVDDRKRSGPTVGELYERYYLPDAARTKAPNTRKRLESIYAVHVGPRWGNVYVTAVKAAEVESWLSTLTFGTAQGALSILRWVMRKSVMLEHIDVSPLEMRITLPDAAKKQSRAIIAGDDIVTYYNVVKNTEIEAPWVLCIAGGLRAGESLGVMVGDIEHRTMDGIPFAAVPIDRAASTNGGISMDDRTDAERLKTPHSARWAIIREPWASRLMELQAAARDRGDTYLTDDGLGQPQGTSWLRRTAYRLYETHGLPLISIRNLRASFATYAHHDLALPTEDVARLMGHSKPLITWGTYERPNLEQIAASVIRG